MQLPLLYYNSLLSAITLREIHKTIISCNTSHCSVPSYLQTEVMLDTLIKLNSSRAGHDKLIRTMQYTCKLIAASSRNRKIYKGESRADIDQTKP